jgi:hypothetical protein
MCPSGATYLPLDCVSEWSDIPTRELCVRVERHTYPWTVCPSGATYLPVDCVFEWSDIPTRGLCVRVERHTYPWTVGLVI